MEVQERTRPTVLGLSLIVFVLFMSTSAYIPGFSLPNNAAPEASEGAIQFVRYVAYLVAAGVVLVFYRPVFRAASRVIPLVLLVGLAILSLFWSVSSYETVASALTLTILTMFGLFLAERYSLAQILIILAVVSWLTVLFSYLYVLVPAMNGIDVEGSWRGAFIHKNLLGLGMVLSILVSIFLGTYRRRHRAGCLILFMLSVVMLFQSDSKTSMAVLVGTLMCLPLLRFAASGSGPASLLVLFTVVALSIILPNLYSVYSSVVDALGRDVTLTGRTEIWEAVRVMIAKRPMLGYGYEAFWARPDGPSTNVIYRVGWRLTHAHNGYLQLWLDLGFFGIFLFLSSFVMAWISAYRSLRTVKSFMGAFPVAFLTLMFAYNLSETALLETSIWWVIYVAMASLRARKVGALNKTSPHFVEHRVASLVRPSAT